MYTCGLTVYARGHIGNFRTFVSLDVLRRALKYQEGYAVRHVMNFTDVDDKTINAAAEAGVSLREYTDRYIAAFREDAAAMGLEPVEENPRATDEANLRAMVEMIRRLEARGHTYRSDGSIYFRIASLPGYGKLARLDHEGIQAGARVDSDTYAKQDARDFVLWKATKPGEPTWDYGCGPGRPGWHIECSAMALRLLGDPPIDIHGGGIDLIFPHHENEIAQAEGATGQPFARFWVHVEFLNLDNEKMSKSLGNVFTVRDILDKGYRASALRYLLMSVHYRKQLTFNWDVLAQAEAALTRLADFLARVEAITGGRRTTRRRRARGRGARGIPSAHRQRPQRAGRARRDLRSRARHERGDGSRDVLAPTDARRIRDAFDEFDRVLGVLALRRAEDASAAGAGRRDRAADRGAARSPTCAAVRARRRDPPGPRSARHPPRRQRGRARAGSGSRLDACCRAPDIKTPLPGPKAPAIIARDSASVSPSYTRDYPFVMARGEGAVVEDVDGNLFLDCAAGIAVTGTGHAHPDVVRAITEQAQKYLHMSGTDFYYEPQVQLAEEIGRARAGRTGQVKSFFSNSGTEAIEAAIKLARYRTQALEHHRVPRVVSRPHAGRAGGDVEQVRAAARLRADDARRVSRALRELLSVSGRPQSRHLRGRVPGLRRGSDPRAPRRRPTRWRRSSSSPSRARAATSCRRSSSISGCASSRRSTACCSLPTKCSPAWAAPAACSPASTSVSTPTSSRSPRASRRGCRSA